MELRPFGATSTNAYEAVNLNTRMRVLSLLHTFHLDPMSAIEALRDADAVLSGNAVLAVIERQGHPALDISELDIYASPTTYTIIETLVASQSGYQPAQRDASREHRSSGRERGGYNTKSSTGESSTMTRAEQANHRDRRRQAHQVFCPSHDWSRSQHRRYHVGGTELDGIHVSHDRGHEFRVVEHGGVRIPVDVIQKNRDRQLLQSRGHGCVDANTTKIQGTRIRHTPHSTQRTSRSHMRNGQGVRTYCQSDNRYPHNVDTL